MAEALNTYPNAKIKGENKGYWKIKAKDNIWNTELFIFNIPCNDKFRRIMIFI